MSAIAARNCALQACLLPVSFAAFLSDGQAAALSESSLPGCDYELRGLIDTGDAARVESISGSYDGVVLCMDSPGGSISGGLALFRVIREGNIMTRIPAGWTCESSCAPAFMAGSIHTGMGVGTFIGEHQLDPGGTLGFHAPGLPVGGEGSFGYDEVAQAFAVAVEAAQAYYLASLEEEGDWRPLNEFLYSRIVGTPFDSMFRIETIGDAVLSNLSLGPIRLPSEITVENITHLCDAAWLRNAPLRYRVPRDDVADAWRDLRHEGALTQELFDVFRTVSLYLQDDVILGYVSGYDLKMSGFGADMMGCEVNIALDSFRQNYHIDTWHENSVQVRFRPLFTSDMDNPPHDWWRDPEPPVREVTVPLWYLHAPQTRLDSLAVVLP